MRRLTANLVQMATVTVGTGSATCTAIAGWEQISDRFAAGDKFYYSITDGNNREVGKSTHGGGNTLVRTTILETLTAGVFVSGGTAISLSGAGATVRVVAPEQLFSALLKLERVSVAASQAATDGFSYVIAANNVVLTLDAAPVVGDRLEIYQGATGITGCTVDPNGGKINNTAAVMNIDVADFALQLVYTGATYGWKVLP